MLEKPDNLLDEFWKIDENVLSQTEDDKVIGLRNVRDYAVIRVADNATVPSWTNVAKQLLVNRVPLSSQEDHHSRLVYHGRSYTLSKKFIDALIDDLLFERYLQKKKSFLAHVPFDYTLLPPKIRVSLFNIYLKMKKDPKFPEWPSDLTVDMLRHIYMSDMKARMKEPIRYIGFWPKDYATAFCLTHDCDSASSFKSIEQIREIEREYGYLSSWNFVPHKYSLDYKKIKSLHEEGCEIGIHDYDHTGKIAFDSADVARRKIRQGLAAFKAFSPCGFRSGLLQRNEKFLKTLSEYFLYDSSVSDTDIYSPLSYRNGACTVFPYFVNKMIEIPLTMPQDWRLIRMGFKEQEILDIWNRKARLIHKVNGVINFNLHPDDFISGNEKYLNVYNRFLKELSKTQDLWMALPRDIAQWWTERANSRIVGGTIKGSERATIRNY